MANERKEPTLSTSALNDTRSSKGQKPVQRSDRRNTSTAARPTARPKSQAKPAPQQALPAKSNNGLVFFVMLLTLAALGIAAYNVWQLQQANNTILDQQARIAELEKKLTVADDASSQSITSLAANFLALNDDVKLSLTEIDKLWATRNVNKKAISDNTEKLTAIETQTQSTQSDLSNAGKKISALESSTKALDESIKNQVKTISEQLAKLTEQTESQTATLASVDTQVKNLESGNQDLERLAQNLKTQTSQQEITLQSLRERVAAGLSNTNAPPSAATTNQINQLAAQVRENQEAVRAIDAFRITVNRELLLLKQRSPAAQ